MTVVPPPDPDEVALLAAALRADSADVGALAGVLTGSLGDALPAGLVEVERERSLSDRLAGRPGRATAVAVDLGGIGLGLRQTRRGPVAEIRHVVRGVVLSRREVGLEEWLQALAAGIADRARRDAAARSALERWLGV